MSERSRLQGRPRMDIDMALAYSLVREQGLSIRRAAAIMGVCHSTLTYRFSARPPRKRKPKRKPHSLETRHRISKAMRAKVAQGWRPKASPRTATIKEALCERCKSAFRYRYFPSARARKYCGRKCFHAATAEAKRISPPTFDILYGLYWDESLTAEKIGTRYGVSQSKVLNWLVELGVPRRKRGAHPTLATCIIDGCLSPVYRVRHTKNGCYYGRRCLMHHALHIKRNGELYRIKLKEKKAQMLIALVEREVPKTLPYEIRDEVCQELILDLLTRKVSAASLRQSIPTYTRRFFREYQDRFKSVSLDAPVGDEDGRTLGDFLLDDGTMVRRDKQRAA